MAPDKASLGPDTGGDGDRTAFQLRAGDHQQPLSFALFALLTTVSIILVALAAPAVFNGIIGTIDSLGWRVSGDVLGGAIAWYHLLSFQIATILLTILMAGVARGQGATLGWHAPIGHRSWLQPLFLAIVVSAISALFAFSFFAEIVERDLAPIRKLIEAGPLWLAFLGLAIGAPLSEELLFRGYLLHRLMQTRLGFWGGALIANTGWTMLHFDYSWLSMADVFLAGLLFSWAMWKTRSIWVPIIFHALYNTVVLSFLLIPSTNTLVPSLW